MLLEKWLLTVQKTTTTSEATLYMFGNNTNGQLGNNSTNFLFSPALIGTSSWTQVAIGNSHTLAIRSDKTLWAWGYNNVGQLGNADRSLINRSMPVQIGTSSWISVSTNTDTSYAVRSDGSLFAWGLNIAGQMGNNQTVSTWTRYSWTSMAAAPEGGAALTSDGSLWTWGFNSSGQLGDNTSITRSSPVQIGSSSWTMVSAANAIRQDGTLWAWGANFNGQSGDGTIVEKSSPIQIGTSSWTMISLSTGIRTDGGLFTWGLNNFGQLGINAITARSSPVQVGTSSWSQVSSGISYTLAIRSDGALWAWGAAANYQLGTLNNLVNRSEPVQITISNNPEYANLSWSQVSASNGNTGQSFALDVNKALWGWGAGSNGAMGQGTATTVFAPLVISSLYTYNNEVAYSASSGKARLSWTSVAVGALHSVGIKNNRLYTWGSNTVGQLGDNTLAPRSSPVQVGTSSWSQVTAGATHTVAIRSDGGLFTWGLNGNGQLGSGTTLNRSSPVQVGTDSWSVVSSTNYQAITVVALRSNNTLWAWGNNSNGQLGINATGDRSSPVQIGTSSWTFISGGYFNTGAIRPDGALFMWGAPPGVGDGTNLIRSSPVQIGTSSWTFVSVGNFAAAAIKSDGTLFTWGNNGIGQLGYNNTITTSSPVQVSSLKTPDAQASYLTAVSKTGYSWTQISSGGGINQGTSFAIRNDGALFGWGSNGGGQLGLGDTIQRFSPVQIGTSSWTQVSVGLSLTVAIRSGGSLFAWGNNVSGQVGDGTTITKSSPVQLGTSSWTAVCAYTTNSLGGWVLAIRSGGSLFSWGNNSNGTLGLNDINIHRSNPTQVGTSSWISLGSVGSGGVSMSMALRSDGGLFAWGPNGSGNLGIGNTINRSSPVQIGTSSWTTLTAGSESPAAIRLDGALFSWGFNALGAVGDGTTVSKSSPVLVGGTSSWTMVSTFVNTSGKHAIMNDGSLWSWGNRTNWTSGTGFVTGSTSSLSLVSVGPTSRSWTNISAGGYGALGLDTTGQLWTWGLSSFGENGQFQAGIFPLSFATFLPSVSDSWIFVTTGTSQSTSAVRSDGAMFAWGDNTVGQLGIGSTVGHRSYPIQVGTGNSWSQVTIGSHAMALTSTGQGKGLFTWGLATSGQLGDLWVAGSSSPVFIRSINDSWINVAANSVPSVVATRIDGTLWAWGTNTNGNLGLDDRNHRSRPTQVGISTSWSSAYAFGAATYAIDNTGLIWSWGDSSLGKLAITNNPASVTGTWLVNRSSPVQLGSTSFSASPTQIGTSSWTSVSAGTSHALAVRSGGSLFAWGVNNSNQVGDNTSINKSSPVQIGTTSWNSVSAGDVHSLAIANDNSLWGWGLRYQVFTYNSLVKPTNFLLTSDNFSWAQISFSNSNTAAIRSDGALFTWGNASNFALLLATNQGPLSPTQVGTSSWSQVSATGSNAVAIRSDGRLFTWGTNSTGAVGDGTTINRSSPVQIGTSSWSKVSTAGSSMFAIRNDGALFAWGSNQHGQLGLTDVVYRSSPVQVGTSSWTMASVGATSMAIRSDSAMFTWGWNTQGQIGDGTTVAKSSPVLIGTSSWTLVVSNNSQSVAAIRSDGRLFTWGYNSNGQLGYNGTTNASSPNALGTDSWTTVAAGSALGMTAIRKDGLLFGWGLVYGNNNPVGVYASSPAQIGSSTWNNVYQDSSTMLLAPDKSLWGFGSYSGGGLGYTNTGNGYSSPVQIPSYIPSPGKLSTAAWNKISAGYSHSVGVLTDGKLYGFGNLAAGNFTPYSWTQISSNFINTAAIRSDGALFIWGNNASGQLGQNNITAYTIQLQVGTSSWSQVNVGNTSIFAIRQDGTLWAWGADVGGTLGLGITNISRSSPVQLGTDSWNMVSIGQSSSTALRSDGALFTWGSNSVGQLGDGTTLNRSSPVQVGTSSWSMVSIRTTHVVAIRSDSGLFTWGQNSSGELGDGTVISKSSPIQIGTSSWSQVSAGDLVGSALRIDKSLWNWGRGNNGQLGQFDSISRSSPVQVTSLGFSEASNSYYFATTGETRYSWIQQRGDSFIRSDNTLWTYGSVSGDGTGNTLLSLVQIGTSSWTSLGSSSAIRADGTLWAWKPLGDSQYGANGDGTTIGRSSPVQVSGGGSWYKVAGSESIISAIRTDGTLWAWGRNTAGQLGNGTIISRSEPVQIGTDSWTQVTNWNSGTGAIRADGALFTWGVGTNGQIGNSSNVHRSSPVQIGTSSWIAVASNAATNGFKAIRADGALFAWGSNTSGNLGDGTTLNKSSPVQIGTSSWIAVASNGLSAIALRKDGALFTWGNNTLGQLGLNDTIARSSPVQIGTSTWSSLGIESFYAILSNGSLYGWTTTPNVPRPALSGQSSPVFITANTNESWTTTSSGGSYNLGLRKDSMLFSWGINSAGQLGDGTTVAKSFPILIGPNQSTPWVLNSTNGIAAGSSSSYVINSFPGRSIFAWGQNSNALLAQNQITGGSDVSARSSPVQIGTYANLVPPVFYNSISQIGTSSWSQVSAELNNTLAINSSGSVFEWGYNSNRPVAGITSVGLTANTVSSNQISAGANAFGVIKPAP